MESSVFLVHLCFSFCFGVTVLLPNVNGNGESCRTVKQKVGQCIEIEKCPSIYNLSQQKPLSQTNELYLTLSWCDGESKVCCADDEDDDDSIEFGDEVAHLLSSRSQAGSGSSTNRENCNCVHIGLCPRLNSLLRTEPFTAEKQNYLRQFICGYQGKVPKVCCPLDEVPPTEHLPIGPIESVLLPSTETCGFLLSDRITGGAVADLGEFPWMALLEYSTPNGSQFNCGGSLINNKYVLTAAHCVKVKNLVSVRLGEHDLSSSKDCVGTFCAEPINVEIVEKIVHEGYDPISASRHHDIALLRLAREVPFTDVVRAICIPTTTDLLNKTYIGEKMTVAGWGLTENNNASDVLRKVEVTVKNTDECSLVYGSSLNFHLGQLCAGGDIGKDSCRGDSGGPLMVQEGANFYVAGVVSFGPERCGLDKWPGVYVRLSYYAQWIVDNLKP